MFNENNQKEAILLTRKMLDLPGIIGGEKKNSHNLKRELTIYLDHLIATDFNKLIGILYRIDISQEKATAALENIKAKNTPGEILANLIIARQWEKIESRKKNKNHLKDSENSGFSEKE